MTIIIRTQQTNREVLQPGQTLTVTADSISNGRVGRLADSDGASIPDVPSAFKAVSAGTSLIVGPFAVRTRHTVEALAGSLSYTIGAATPPLPLSGDATDLVEMFGAGTPTDGTTGVNVAGIGSRYTDLTAGKLYVQGGTKASPAWKIVTSA